MPCNASYLQITVRHPGCAVATALRTTGINTVGDRPWGTHFCHFYETRDDLLDTLIPYFRASGGRSPGCPQRSGKAFCDYEKALSESLTDQPMTHLCAYPLGG